MKDPFIEQAKQILIWCRSEFQNIMSQIQKEYEKQFRIEADNIIKQWYAGYSARKYYNPTGSLYSIYDIEIVDYNTYFRMGPEYMHEFKHNQDNEIIYNNAVIGGYHGGSWGEDYHGDSVTLPHYRVPYETKNKKGQFRWWGDVAWQTPVNLEEVLSELDDQIYEKTKQKYKKKWADVAKKWNIAYHYLFG